MRERFSHSAALIVFALLSANLKAAPAAYWNVANQPVRLVNGTPVLFRVTTPRPVRSLSANWMGHDILFSFDASSKTWFALAGVSLETKPGIYPLELHGETLSKQSAGEAIPFERKIPVARQRYPRVLLKVPGRYTAPSAEDQREIEQDKETKVEAFKTVSAVREWKGSFAAPVEAAISDVFGVERVFNGTV